MSPPLPLPPPLLPSPQQREPKSPPPPPGSPAARPLPRLGPVAMEDFIVISDDSGSESSGGARSGRARRLRRALSRTPGALPRRTVVSERAAARQAPPRRGCRPLTPAWPAVPCAPASRPLVPHSCSRFPPPRPQASPARRSAAGQGRGGQASRAPRSSRSGPGLATAAEHMDRVWRACGWGCGNPLQ